MNGDKRLSVGGSDCPIGLDKVHCQNCYFWWDGKCDYDAILREHTAKKAKAKVEEPKPTAKAPEAKAAKAPEKKG